MSDMGYNFGPELPTLTARRVRLRWLTEKDVPSLFTIFGDREVTCYWGHSVLPDLDAAVTLLEDIRTKFVHQSLFQWGIASLDTDALIDRKSVV